VTTDISVRLQPRSSKDAVVGYRDGVLAVRVTAPPVDGRANQALCRLLARHLGIAPSRVTLVRGDRSRVKVIRITGIDRDSLVAALLLPRVRGSI